jgi:hypothetical protein
MKLTNNKLTIDKLQILTVPVGSPIHNIGVDNTGNVVRGTNSSGVTQAQVQQMLIAMYNKCCKPKFCISRTQPNDISRPHLTITTTSTLYSIIDEVYIPIKDTTNYKEYISLSMYDKIVNDLFKKIINKTFEDKLIELQDLIFVYKSNINLVSDEDYVKIKEGAKQDGYKPQKIYPLILKLR